MAPSPSVLKNVELLDLVGVFHHTFKLVRSNKLLQLKEVIEIILTLNLLTVLVYLFLPSSVKLTVNKKKLSILLFNFLGKEKTKLEVKRRKYYMHILRKVI